MAEVSYTLHQDGRLIFEDVDLVELMEYLIANRIGIIPDIEEQREQLELLTVIQDHAPRA